MVAQGSDQPQRGLRLTSALAVILLSPSSSVAPPMADGFLRPLQHPESRVLVSLLYPLRGAEALAMVAVMGVAFWGFTILVPEYCLSVWADASTLGTPSMGMLVILISALPALLLFPLIVIYLLQYLGRVLVSAPWAIRFLPARLTATSTVC